MTADRIYEPLIVTVGPAALMLRLYSDDGEPEERLIPAAEPPWSRWLPRQAEAKPVAA